MAGGGAPPTTANGNGHLHYANQQQQQQYHRHYQPRRSSSAAASFKGCCCCLFLLLVFLALLVAAVALFVFFALKPKKPQFELQQVSVHYLIFTTSSAATYLSLNISLLFTASNPNKVGIKYSPADLYVMYKGVPLGVARVPAFFQPAHSLSSFSAGVAVDRLDVSMVNAADLVRDAAVNDRVDLNVVGDVAARIRVLGINSPKVKVL